MEILSAGEKIKRLRTNLGLRQDDIRDKSLSKSFICLLEQGKRGLTQQTAEVIVECLNKHYSKIGEEITVEYLLETEEEQARKIILKYIDELQEAIQSDKPDAELINNIFTNALELSKMGEFPRELIELKILKGNFHYNNYRYKDAISSYLDALDHCCGVDESGQTARIFILLGRIYQMQLLTENAIIHYAKAYNHVIANNTANKDEIKAYSVFNQIICYGKLRRYDLVLSHINLFKSLKWADPRFRIFLEQIRLMEANAYRDIENWGRAIEIYEKLLKEGNKIDIETLFLTYENYAVLHRNKGNNRIALEYIDKAFSLKDQVDSNYIPALYLYQATCRDLKKEYEEAITILERGLRLAEEVAKKQIVIELRFAIVEIYIGVEQFEKALEELQILEGLMDESTAMSLHYDLYSFFIEVYNGLGDLDKCVEYTVKIRQKNYFID